MDKIIGRANTGMPVAIGFVFLLMAAFQGAAEAHGVKYDILEATPIALQASYDSGQPIPHAKVLVYAPGKSESDHESASDGNGVFCFLPDKAGEWKIEMSDRLGHGIRVSLNIDKDLNVEDLKEESKATLGLKQKLIMAFCVIWGALGTALFFKRKGKA